MSTADSVLTTLVTLSGLALALGLLTLSAVRRLAGRVAALEARTAVETVPHGVVPVVNPAPTSVRNPAPVLRVDGAGSSVVTGPVLISVPNLAAAAPPQPPAQGSSSSELGHRYAAIWEMAAAGGSAEMIALATGQPVGQIELILGLKRRGPAKGGPRRP